mmetsp:Transcript_29845/g.46804  ORF Transcript_29845/g.46804 Transcript_29845/m.46804 type:complete len:109 (+) Transcript_29845:364-690(+)
MHWYVDIVVDRKLESEHVFSRAREISVQERELDMKIHSKASITSTSTKMQVQGRSWRQETTVSILSGRACQRGRKPPNNRVRERRNNINSSGSISGAADGSTKHYRSG